MNIKKRFIAFAVLLLAAISTFIAASVQSPVTAAPASVYKFGPATMTLSEVADGYSVTGTLGWGYGGFILPEKVNVGEELSFKFSALVDSGEELKNGGIQNRLYSVSVNEYPGGSLNDTLVRNYGTRNGYQLVVETRFSGSTTQIIVTMYAGSTNQNTVTLTENTHPYFISAFRQAATTVTADPKIAVKLYPSDANGVKASRRDATHYAAELRCYDTQGNLKELIATRIAKTYISSSGDFSDEAYLGLFILNQAVTVKTIDINAGIYSVCNGLTADMELNVGEIKALKAGEPVQLIPELTAREQGADLSGITFSYYSDDPDIAAVSADGMVSAAAQFGRTKIRVFSSNGHLNTITVTLFDDTAPQLFIDSLISVPESVTQYQTVTLPNFTATDEAGTVVQRIEVISPVGFSIPYDAAAPYYNYIPTETGKYIIEYSAEDLSGNTAKEYIEFFAEPDPDKLSWSKFGTYNSGIILEELEGGAVRATGQVGNMTYGSVQDTGLYYNNAILFNKNSDGSYTDVQFSYKVDYKKGTPAVDNVSTDQSRFLLFTLVEGALNNTMSGDLVGWNNSGIMLSMGQRHFVNGVAASADLIWYELRAGQTQLSRQHTTAIDPDPNAADPAAAQEYADTNRLGAYAKGSEYLPWFEYGDARNWAAKFTTGQDIAVRIEYYDSNSPGWDGTWNQNYYVLTMNTMKFRIPAKLIAGNDDGFRRQAYIAFMYRSTNGVLPFDITVSKVVNGSISAVVLEDPAQRNYKLGDKFSLAARSVGNEEDTVADTFTYASSDTSIATISADGNVEIVGIGNAIISAQSLISQKIGLYNIDVHIEGLAIADKTLTMYLDDDGRLDISTNPSGAPLKYHTSDPRIVAVLNNGILQAVGLGTVTITVSYMDWSDTCEVTVLPASEKPDGNGKEQPVNCGSAIGAALPYMTLLLSAVMTAVMRKKKRADSE